MRKKSLLVLSLFALVFPMGSTVTAEDLEELGEEVQTPAILEPEEASEEAPQPLETPWLPESFKLEASSGSCGPEDRCQDPLPTCEVNADCVAPCPAACENPICVPLRLSFCISSLPPVADKVCQCL